MRTVVAEVAGILTGGILTMIAEMVSHQLYPPPVIVENDFSVLEEFFNSLPMDAWAILIFSWLVGAFGAGLVSSIIAKHNWKKAALIAASILLLFHVINFITIPHPWYVIGLVVVFFIPAAYSGAKLVGPKK